MKTNMLEIKKLKNVRLGSIVNICINNRFYNKDYIVYSFNKNNKTYLLKNINYIHNYIYIPRNSLVAVVHEVH